MPQKEHTAREAIKEFWIAALLIAAAFAAAVAGIYITEAVAYKKEQERLEILANQRKLELAAKKEALLTAYTWENIWPPAREGVPDRWQARSLAEMKPGIEYQVGQLQRYDMRDEIDIGPDDIPKQFDRVLLDEHDNIYSDDMYYHDPVVTVVSGKFLHIRSSMDGGDAWFLAGETERGLKTDTLKYIPQNPTANEKRDYYGSGAISFQAPVNGTRGLAFDKTSKEICEEMRLLNYSYTETLGEIYAGENIPEEFKSRTRTVTTSQVVVDIWSRDPRIVDKHTPKRPEATFRFIYRSYGAWDVTPEEYEQLKVKVTLFSQFDFRSFSPRTTVEMNID